MNLPNYYCYKNVYLQNKNVIDTYVEKLGSCILANSSSPELCQTNFKSSISSLSNDTNLNNIINSFKDCISKNQPTQAPSKEGNSNYLAIILPIIFILIIIIIYFVLKNYYCSKSYPGAKTSLFFMCKKN
jgi:ATP-dependent Zn protease